MMKTRPEEKKKKNSLNNFPIHHPSEAFLIAIDFFSTDLSDV
jgi:hypothetical protein